MAPVDVLYALGGRIDIGGQGKRAVAVERLDEEYGVSRPAHGNPFFIRLCADD